MAFHKVGFDIEDTEAARAFKRVLDDSLYSHGLKVTDAARRLNISSERMYKYLNPETVNNFPAYLIPIFTLMIGPELLRYVASEAGYSIVKLPEIRASLDAVQAASRALKECCEAVEEFSKALEDGRVSLWELKDLRREIAEAVEALLGLQVLAEEIRDGKAPEGGRGR